MKETVLLFECDLSWQQQNNKTEGLFNYTVLPSAIEWYIECALVNWMMLWCGEAQYM
jgi:hypothetical protein